MTDIEHVPQEREMPSSRRDLIKGLLIEEIGRRSPWWRRTRRNLTVSVGALALMVAGGTATAAYVAFKPATDTRSVQCFAAASRDAAHSAPRVFVANKFEKGMTAKQRAATPVTQIKDPVKLCGSLWRSGILRGNDAGTIHDVAPAGVAPSPVPRLISCTLDDGIAGVFPGDTSTCERLGLPRTTTG